MKKTNTDMKKTNTDMKTDSQRVDINEYFPRIKVHRMSKFEIDIYQLRNKSMLEQLGEYN